MSRLSVSDSSRVFAARTGTVPGRLISHKSWWRGKCKARSREPPTSCRCKSRRSLEHHHRFFCAEDDQAACGRRAQESWLPRRQSGRTSCAARSNPPTDLRPRPWLLRSSKRSRNCGRISRSWARIACSKAASAVSEIDGFLTSCEPERKTRRKEAAF